MGKRSKKRERREAAAREEAQRLSACYDVLEWATNEIKAGSRRLRDTGMLSADADLVARLCAATVECAGRQLRRAIKQELTDTQEKET